jgi:hypothetical protein
MRNRHSVEFLIWAARKSTGHEGEQAMFFEAVHGLNMFGICTESQRDATEGPLFVQDE